MITTESRQNPSMPDAIPSYTVRQLPPAEWDRLLGLPFARAGLPNPDLTAIFVAEDAAGAIVGIWAAMTAVHLDGLWIDPAHRDTTIAGRLLRTMKAFLTEKQIPVSFTVISDPAVMVLAHKGGFTRYPGDLWVLNLPEEGT